jgi:hypothetical protein
MQLNFKWSFYIELEGGIIVIGVLINIMPHNKNHNFKNKGV